MGLISSVPSVRAKSALMEYARNLTAYDFNSDAHVVLEDGGTFFVSNAFLFRWIDPEDPTQEWIFLHAEHQEPMYWHKEDVVHYRMYKALNVDTNVEECLDCLGTGEIEVGDDDFKSCPGCEGRGWLLP